jgi:hypothetical protein
MLRAFLFCELFMSKQYLFLRARPLVLDLDKFSFHALTRRKNFTRSSR